MIDIFAELLENEEYEKYQKKTRQQERSLFMALNMRPVFVSNLTIQPNWLQKSSPLSSK